MAIEQQEDQPELIRLGQHSAGDALPEAFIELVKNAIPAPDGGPARTRGQIAAIVKHAAAGQFSGVTDLLVNRALDHLCQRSSEDPSPEGERLAS